VEPPPRLLVTVPAEPGVRARVAAALPGVPAEFSTGTPAAPRPSIEALLVGNAARELPGLRPELLPSLRLVQTLYTGLDGFPFDRVGPEVAVAGNVGALAPFVGEHAVAMVLALARDLLPGHAQVLAGRLRPTPSIRFLSGKTAVIVGFGAIGGAAAERLRCLGLRIVGVSRTGAPDARAEETVALDRLEEALGRAAVVIDALPLTRATRGLFDRRRLERLPAESIFVNVGRAETVDPAALEQLLASRPGFRAGLDVWWEEDFPDGRLGLPFDVARYPNLLGSPHRSGVVPEAREYVLDRALENLARFFRGEAPRYVGAREEYDPGG
jgi:phosphoglycerate dehydrogenase-like enzyme